VSKLIVIGHKNPDTDSIVSAIVAKDYFKSAFDIEAEARSAGELNNETKFILETFEVSAPEMAGTLGEGDKVALVDHNDINQMLDGSDYTRVDYVLDHHKLTLKSDAPIFCRIEPVGSTSTLLAKMFAEKNISVSETDAKLLIAGILSDTLNLTSPTTTDDDRKILEELNKIASLDIAKFASEMFKAKSSLEGISLSDIITLDYKNFEMGTHKVGVGTWETTHPESVNEKKDEIMGALSFKKQAEDLEYIFFMVADILQQNSQLYVVGEEEQILAEKVFGQKAEDKIIFLPGVVSRKKQVIPPLTEELTK